MRRADEQNWIKGREGVGSSAGSSAAQALNAPWWLLAMRNRNLSPGGTRVWRGWHRAGVGLWTGVRATGGAGGDGERQRCLRGGEPHRPMGGRRGGGREGSIGGGVSVHVTCASPGPRPRAPLSERGEAGPSERGRAGQKPNLPQRSSPPAAAPSLAAAAAMSDNIPLQPVRQKKRMDNKHRGG